MRCDQCGRYTRYDAYYARWWCNRCERQPLPTIKLAEPTDRKENA